MMSKNDVLYAKARSAYAHLLDKKEELDQMVEALADRLDIKKSEVMTLIKADSVAGECAKTMMQLDMFDDNPGKGGTVARIV